MRLSTRLLLAILATIIISMAAMGWLTFTNSRDAVTNSAMEQTRQAARSVSDESAAAIETMSTSLRLLATEQGFAAALLQGGGVNAALQLRASDRLNQAKTMMPRFSTLALLDERGILFASSTPHMPAVDWASVPAIAQALHGVPGHSMLTLPFTSPPTMLLAQPVLRGGHVIGVVLGQVDLPVLSRGVLEHVAVAKPAYVFVTDHTGLVLFHPKEQLVGRMDLGPYPFMESMLTSKSGTTSLNLQGVDYLAAYITMPSTSWLVVSLFPEEALLAPIHTTRNDILAMISMTVLIMGFVIMLIVRNITRALNQGVEFADAVARGELDRTLPIHRTDEIGTLANALRTMVTRLRETISQLQRKTSEAEQANAHLVAYRSHLEDMVETRTNELVVARDTAEKAARVKSEFLSRMSHEIRTPMNAIIGLTYLALQTTLTTHQRDYLNKIQQAARSLLGILDAILDFSQLDANRLLLTNQPFYLSTVLDRLQTNLAPRAAAKGLHLHIDRTRLDATAGVVGDMIRLEQVLLNLGDNALKFTEQGSVEIMVCTEPQNSNTLLLRVAVQDTGIGMTPEQMETLFTFFSSADNSMTRRHGGTGLGLAIAHHLVERMHGRIRVVSAFGKGSTFEVEIPLPCASTMPHRLEAPFRAELPAPCAPALPLAAVRNTLPAVVVPASVTATSIRPSAAQVLLVEDNDINQEIALELLSSIHVTAAVANDGAEAVHMVQQQPFALVLMDIQMPIMDGLEATRRIRALGFSAEKLPIVAMTAHASHEDLLTSLEAGMNDHLTKPLDPQALLALVKRFVAANENVSTPEEATDAPAQVHRIMPNELPAELAGIDLNTGLEHVSGNAALYMDLLRRFADRNKNMAQELKTALARDDKPKAMLLAHTLKGVAASLGAKDLAAVSGEVEHALRMDEEVPGDQLELLHSRLDFVLKGIMNSMVDPLSDAPTAQAARESANEHAAEHAIDKTAMAELLTQLTLAIGQDVQNARHLLDAVAPQIEHRRATRYVDVLNSPGALEEMNSRNAVRALAASLGIRLNEQHLDMPPSRVLAVDDAPENLRILVETLRDSYPVMAAANGRAALRLARSKRPPDIILLDVLMPDMDGYEVCRQLKEDEATRDIPILFITSSSEKSDEAQGLALGAVDYIVKPFQPDLLKNRVRNQLELKQHRNQLESLVRARTHELLLTREVTIETLANLAECRSLETGGHIRRTQNYVRLLGEYMREIAIYAPLLPPYIMEQLNISAPLHDVGKVGVPDAILLKPGKLTPEEFEIMKLHTVYGRDALAAAEAKLGGQSFLSLAKDIAYSHHERWDGRGYPQGLAGDSIPLAARIMSVADVYDALISKRAYKDAMRHEAAANLIIEGRGTQFDPGVVDAFVQLEAAFLHIADTCGDKDMPDVVPS